MFSKFGGCCCPCQGTGACMNMTNTTGVTIIGDDSLPHSVKNFFFPGILPHLTGMPTKFYIRITGEVYDPGFTTDDLIASGLLPDFNFISTYTGWTKTVDINYNPNIFSWALNKSWLLRNQNSWKYNRPGQGYPDIRGGPSSPDDISDPEGCFFFDNPYSGTTLFGGATGQDLRMNCFYEFSRISEFADNLMYYGIPGGIGPPETTSHASYQFYENNVEHIGTGYSPIGCQNNQYQLFLYGHSVYNPQVDGPNIPCQRIAFTDYAGIGSISDFIRGDGYSIVYKTDISDISINESVDIFEPHGSDEHGDQRFRNNSISAVNCGKLYIQGPRVYTDTVHNDNTTGTLFLDIGMMSTIDCVIEFGDDIADESGNTIDGPEGQACRGIDLPIGDWTDPSPEAVTYDASITVPEITFQFRLFFPVPTRDLGDPLGVVYDCMSYKDLTKYNFKTISSGAWCQLNIVTDSFNFQPNNFSSNRNNYEYAGIYYTKILNGLDPNKKTAHYKIMTAGVKNIGVQFLCEPTGTNLYPIMKSEPIKD